MAENGSFLREITETRERTAAWIFRLAIGLNTAAFSVIGWLLTSTINDLRANIDRQSKTSWEAIGELNRSTASITSTLTTLNASFADHAREDAKEEEQVNARLLDHEARIRILENPLRAHPAN